MCTHKMPESDAAYLIKRNSILFVYLYIVHVHYSTYSTSSTTATTLLQCHHYFTPLTLYECEMWCASVVFVYAV